MNNLSLDSIHLFPGEKMIESSRKNTELDPSPECSVPWLTDLNHWNKNGGLLENTNCQDLFAILSDANLDSNADAIFNFGTQIDDSETDELRGKKRTASELDSGSTKKINEDVEEKRKDLDRPRIRRSAEKHNKSERQRRNKIKMKMQALQRLIPNCYKSDKASMLEDAINYLKALKLQVQLMMSMGGSAVCQVPSIPQTGTDISQQVPCTPQTGTDISQLPQFCQFDFCSFPSTGMIGLVCMPLFYPSVFSSISQAGNFQVPCVQTPSVHQPFQEACSFLNNPGKQYQF